MADQRLLALALNRLTDEPVLLLEGPRSVGKSTLLRQLGTAVGATVHDPDDLGVLEAIHRDPAVFVAGPTPVFIDEYPKVPQVLVAIEAELIVDTRPGRFALTGSTRHDALPPAAQALTGRLHKLTVYPLSQGETDGVPERLLPGLFIDPAGTVAAQPISSTTLSV